VKTKLYILANEKGNIRYIGKTSSKLHNRLIEHLYESRKGRKNYRCNWIRSVLSRGFIPTIVLIGEVEGDGCKEEIAWIQYFRDEGVRLVNMTDGGEGCFGYRGQAGKKNPFFGKHHSLEARQKMSAKRRGKKFSPEHCQHIGEGNKGKHHSAETCRKISLANKGKIKSAELCQRMSESAKNNTSNLKALRKRNKSGIGKRHTLEHCRKISKALKNNPLVITNCRKMSELHKGKHLSDETRKKISISEKASKGMIRMGFQPMNGEKKTE